MTKIEIPGYSPSFHPNGERPTIVIDRKNNDVSYYNVQPKEEYLAEKERQKRSLKFPNFTPGSKEAIENYKSLLDSIGMSKNESLLNQVKKSNDQEFLKQHAHPKLNGTKEEQEIAAAAETRLVNLQWFGAEGEQVNSNNALPHYTVKYLNGMTDSVIGAAKGVINYGNYAFNKVADELEKKNIDPSVLRLITKKNEETKNALNKSEYLDSNRNSVGTWALGDAVASGVGNTTASAAVNTLIPGAGLPFLGMSAAGNASEKAIKEGADVDKALIYGVANGATEVATELLFDSNLLMRNNISFGQSIDEVLDSVIGKVFSSSVGKTIANFFKESLEEGSEEYISEVVGEFLTDIYKKDKPDENFGDYINRLWKVQPQALESGLIGALSSAVTNGMGMGAELLNKNKNDEQILPFENTENKNDEIALSDINRNILSTSDEINKNAVINIPMQSDEVKKVMNQTSLDSIENQLKSDEIETIKKTDVIPKSTKFVIDSLNSHDSMIKFQSQNINAKNIEESAKKVHIQNIQNVESIKQISNSTSVPVRFVESLENNANGMYKDGTIYISKTSNDPAMTVLVHEMTHHIETSGLYNEYKSEILKLAGMDDNFQGYELGYFAKNIKKSYEEITGGKLQLDDNASESEAIAVLSQELLFKDEKSINQLAAHNKNIAVSVYEWIKNTLSKLFSHDSPYKQQLQKTEKLYREAIKNAESGIAKAGEVQYSINKSLEEQVDEVLNHKLGKHETVYIRDTPQLLASLGMKKLPILINQNHVETVIQKEGNIKDANYHGLGKEVFLKIPDAMEKPLIITKNKATGRFVLLLSLSDPYGIPIIAAIHPNARSLYNKLIIANNNLVSAYGKSNSINYFEKRYDESEIIFPENIKKDQIGKLIAGLQLSGNISQSESTVSIRQDSKNDNDFSLKNKSEHSESDDAKFSMPVSAEELLLNKKRTKSKSELVQSGNRRALLSNLKDLFFVSSADAKSIVPIIADVETEVMKTGNVSKSLRQQLFSSLWESGRVTDRDYYDQYSHVQEEIKEMKFKLDSSLKNDIPDFSSFKNKYKGILNFTNSGTPVESLYQELRFKSPELFSPEITHPTDQLLKISDILDDIRIHEATLDLTFKDDPDFKSFVQQSMNREISNFIHETELTKKYEEDRERLKRKHDILPLPADEILSVYKEKQRLDKLKQGISKKVLLTEKDRAQLNRLLKGEIEFSELSKNSNFSGIKKMYDIQKQIDDAMDPIQRFDKARKKALFDKSSELLKSSMKWKDKVAGIQYSRETMERNLRNIIHDEKTSKEISDYLFKPVHDNEAEATRIKNKFRNRVKELKLSVQESELVQQVGEGIIKAEDFYAMDVDHDKINKSIDEFKKIYSELYDLINITLVQNGYKPIEFRKDYFPHFSEDDSAFAKLGRKLGMQLSDTPLPTDIAGLTHTFRPGKNWFANELRRMGKKTTYDAVEGIDRYIENSANVIYHTEDIQRLRSFENALRYKHSNEGIKDAIDEIREDSTLDENEKLSKIDEITQDKLNNLGNFATEIRSYTDTLAGKKNVHDRPAEQDFGRRYYTLAKAMENRVSANMVALNPGSWITNFIPITQAYSQVSSENMIKALDQTMRNCIKNDGFENESSFLTNRLGSEKLNKTKIQKVTELLAKPMRIIDEFTSNFVTRAKYLENIKSGMDETESLSDADQFAAKIIADRSKGSLPTLFNRTNFVTKLFTQFQLEQNNQLSYLIKDLPDDLKEKGWKVIFSAFFKYSLGAWLYNFIYYQLTGRKPALSPIDMVSDSVIRFSDPDVKKSEATLKTATNIVEQLPFVGGLMGGGRLPINAAISNVSNLGNSFVGGLSGEINSKKAWDTVKKEIAKPIFYLLPPVGGGQAKKVVDGLSATARGGVYGVNSEGENTLKYYVEPTLPNIIQSVLFGPTSTKQGKAWINSGFPSLSGKKTEAYEGLKDSGVKMESAYEFIKSVGNIKGIDDGSGGIVEGTKSEAIIDGVEKLGIENEKLNDFIQSYGKSIGISESSQKQMDAYSKLDEYGGNLQYAKEFIDFINNSKGLKNKNGNIIQNSKSAVLIEGLQNYGLNGNNLINYIKSHGEDLGISQTVQEMSEQEIRDLIKKCKEKEGQ